MGKEGGGQEWGRGWKGVKRGGERWRKGGGGRWGEGVGKEGKPTGPFPIT